MTTFQDQNTVTLSAINAAANNQPIIYTGVTAVLNVTMTNATGSDITMDSTSNMQIFMPRFFTQQQVGAMTVTNISQAGWTFKQATGSLLINFTNQSGTWTNGSTITFNINNVVSTSTPATQAMVVNLNNLNGQNVPAGVNQNLSVTPATNPVNTDITKVLYVTADNQGSVFVSVESDPLNNRIYLNFKNYTNNPLYNDPNNMWSGSPLVTVTFVYGSTIGSLAPIAKGAPGPAWQIGVSADGSQDWGYKNLTDTDQYTSPSWQLYPNPTNKDIIGTGDKANVTFQFNNINSFTPAGHTQMYVMFSNFPATSTKLYDSHMFVVDIVKQQPPMTRGLLSFFAPGGSIISLTQPKQNIDIDLRWSMFYVDNIKIICNVPGVQAVSKNYFQEGQTPILNYDSCTLTIPLEVSQNTPVFITVQAYNNSKAYLNSMQFTVFISVNFFIDPAGTVYPTIFINNQIWLGKNYQYNAGNGSAPYGNNAGNISKYGMLYTHQVAKANVPPGWRLPTQQDWDALINSLIPKGGTSTDAYNALIEGGTANFNAELGGYGDSSPQFNQLALNGYYWCDTPDQSKQGNYIMASFYSNTPRGATVNVLGSYPQGYFLSLRYVKNS